MRILSACRHICSSFRASVSSSVIDNEAFSCIRFDIIKGWFFRRARSVILCKHFCCRSNTHISSLSNSCLQPGKLLVSSTKQSDSFLSTCTPCKQIERLKGFLILHDIWAEKTIGAWSWCKWLSQKKVQTNSMLHSIVYHIETLPSNIKLPKQIPNRNCCLVIVVHLKDFALIKRVHSGEVVLVSKGYEGRTLHWRSRTAVEHRHPTWLVALKTEEFYFFTTFFILTLHGSDTKTCSESESGLRTP